MKRWMAVLILILTVFSLPIIANAENSAHIYINGNQWSGDQEPVLIDSHVYVPLSMMKDALGFQTQWDAESREMRIDGNANTVTMVVPEQHATVNGKQVDLDASAVTFNGLPYVPIMQTGVFLQIKVTWDALNKSLYLFKSEKQVSIQSVSADELAQMSQMDSQSNGSSGDGGGSAAPADNPLIGPANAGGAADFSITQVLKTGKTALISAIQATDGGIVIQADSAVQPFVFAMHDPERIVMDLPNARFADKLNGAEPEQNGEIAAKQANIDKIRYALFSNSPETIRIVLDLKQPAAYQVSTDAKLNRVTLSIPSKVYKVVIDPGHGGKDPGASGLTIDEKWLTLSIAQKVYADLRQSPLIEPYMTRQDDTYVTLDDRVNLANQMDAAAFLSIHMNVFDSSDVRGTETYYSRDDSISFAQAIHQNVLSATGFPDREVRQADFHVIKNTTMPAALLEVGYISNKTDESQIKQDAVQEKVAAAIAAGIEQYFLSRNE